MLQVKILSSIYAFSVAFFSTSFLQDSTNITFAPSLTYGLIAGIATGAMSYGILRGKVNESQNRLDKMDEHTLLMDSKLDEMSNTLAEIKGIMGSRIGDKDAIRK